MTHSLQTARSLGTGKGKESKRRENGGRKITKKMKMRSIKKNFTSLNKTRSRQKANLKKLLLKVVKVAIKAASM